MKNVFKEGQEITLMEALSNREERVIIQQGLLESSKFNTLISLKMNIPGPVKTNRAIEKIFHTTKRLLCDKLASNHIEVESETCRFLPTGPEGYFIVGMDGVKAKHLCLELEEEFMLSPLTDLDIYVKQDNLITDISRETFGVSKRHCFVCQEDAKTCARSKKHSLNDIQEELMALYVAYYIEEIKKDVSRCAARALLYEVTCTPKPGLVDAVDSGAHDDMTVYTFIDSSLVLMPFFDAFFDAGYTYPKTNELSELFEQIRPIGLKAEEAMNQATKQVNTHKGAIFSLGILITAVGYLYSYRHAIDLTNLQEIVKEMLKDLLADFNQIDKKDVTTLTIGEKLFIDYGITGIRGEASAGYPIVFDKALPYFHHHSSNDMTERMIDTLLFLLRESQDTNLIKRAGTIDILEEIADEANSILMCGGTRTNEGYQLYLKMIDEFKERNLSIGGTADLLILTLFLSFIIENE